VLLSFFVSCNVKGYYHVVSARQLSMIAACTGGTASLGVKQTILFSIFELNPQETVSFVSHQLFGFSSGETRLTVSLGASH